MSTNLQSTPNRVNNQSPQLYTRSRRKSPSPFSKNGETIIKSMLSTRRTTEQFSEKNEKIRQLETQKSRLEQRLIQSQEQNKALEQTLKERIQMYKRILKEKEEKAQSTIQSIQTQFRNEFSQLNQEKEEEQKFFQQQTEMLAQKIELLENQNYQLEQKVTNQLNLNSTSSAEIEKLSSVIKLLNLNYDNMLNEKNQQIQKLQHHSDALQNQLHEHQSKYSILLQQTSINKNQELTSLRQKLSAQIKSLEQLRISENRLKDNQIAQLKSLLEAERLKFTHMIQAQQLRYDHLLEAENFKNQKSLDEESRRLMELLNTKQQVIQKLSRELSQNQCGINFLSQQNNNFKAHISELQMVLRSNQRELLESKQLFRNQKQYHMQIIEELKEEIRLNQMNYIRQKDKNGAIYHDNLVLQQAAGDREILQREIRDLKLLLDESSKEIERCREKFLTFQKENKQLIFQLERTEIQKNTLLRIRKQLEEEALKWKQNYFRVSR